MNIGFSPTLIALITKLFIAMAMFKLLQVIALYFLPQQGVYKLPAKSIDLPYYALRLDKSFEKPQPIKEVKKEPVKEIFPIESLLLKAIYADINDESRSFIIVLEKGNNKSKILSMGEKIKDYLFIALNFEQKEAIFEARGKTFNLAMDKIKSDKKTPVKSFNMIDKELTPPANTDDVILAVPREEILKYRRNFKAIWKNISIREVVKNGKIDGFLVQRIKSGTIFSKLGLKKGDIIKKQTTM